MIPLVPLESLLISISIDCQFMDSLSANSLTGLT